MVVCSALNPHLTKRAGYSVLPKLHGEGTTLLLPAWVLFLRPSLFLCYFRFRVRSLLGTSVVIYSNTYFEGINLL